jgi:hypothetical protein
MALVDGREVSASLQITPGQHLVQVRHGEVWETWTAVTDGPLDIVVLPALDPIELATDPEDRELLGRTMDTEGLRLVVGDELWRWTGEEWILTPARPGVPASKMLAVGGGGVAAVGLVTGVTALSVGLSAKRDAEDWQGWPGSSTAQDWEDNFEGSLDRIQAANRAQVVGWSVLGAGLATAGVGLLLSDPEAPVQLGPATVVVRW